MNSAPISDAAPAPLPTAPPARSLPAQKGECCEPFGAILEDVTASADVDVKDPETETTAPEKPVEGKEKKKNEAPTDAPLVCFCPPPVIDVPATSAPPTSSNPIQVTATLETTSPPTQTIAPSTNAE